MEGTPLYNIIHTLEKPTPIQELNESTVSITVIIHKNSEPESITIENMAPFHTIEDLSRVIFNQTKDQELFPRYSFLCTIENNNYIPCMLTWIQGERDQILLQNPEEVIKNGIQQDLFVEEDGTMKLSTRFLPRGRITLEDAFSDQIPEFHIFSLQYLLSLYSGIQPISEKDWYGLFYPYFYQVDRQGTYLMDYQDEKFAKDIKTYVEEKQKTIENLNNLLQTMTELHELTTTNVKYLSFIWKDVVPEFEGVDVYFYSSLVNERKPYMRLLTPNNTPLTKLYQPNEYGLPYVNDITLLKSWVQDKSPDSSKNCLYIKVLLRKEAIGLNPLYGTLMMFDEGDAKFIIQPPKDLRSLDFRADLSQLLDIFNELSVDMPGQILEDVKLDKANITVDLDFKINPPKNIRNLVESRLEHLGTIFQKISPPEDQPKPLFMLRYKAVSNFIREDTITNYLSYYITRKGINDEKIKEYTYDIAKEFEITQEAALEKITDYFEKRQQMTLSDPDTREYVSLSSSGTDISIVSKDVNTYSLHIYNLRSEKDLIRIISILSGVFLSDEDTWDEFFSTQPKSVEKVEEKIQEKSIKVERTAIAAAASIKFATELIDVGDEDEGEDEQYKEDLKQEQSKVSSKDVPQQIIAHKWFINRLQQIDNRLFGYPKVKGVSHYSSQCASNEDRYPAVFTEAQYLRMRKYYTKAEEEGKVGFIIYGVPNTEELRKDVIDKKAIEQISVLRYGSDTQHPNYYLCSEYYCLRDLLPVLKADWESNQDYEYAPKNPESCPFCHGTIIIDPKNPGVGQTVVRRKIKPRSREEKRHLYIGFLGEGKNPNGYDMPCCFIKEQKMGWMDPRFQRFREIYKTSLDKAISDKVENYSDKKQDLQKSLALRTQQLISYDLLKFRIHKEYVVGSEKHPLDPGKIGMPNVALDNFFLQESSLFVARSAIKQEFKPNVNGMFRLGVLNRVITLNDSLFSAIAPALGRNSIHEVKKHLIGSITPRVFINLNFGNLLIEFFNPSDEEPSPSELSMWGQRHLQINKAGTEYELSRFYRSYHRFINYINDSTQKKLLRHFVHALAEPGLLINNGLTLVVLKYEGDPRESTSSIKVLCPSLGYNIDRYERNDIGFLTYHDSGIWEPLIYISNIIKNEVTPLHQEGFYTIPYTYMSYSNFPKAIRDRYMEFVTECRSSFRGAYTYQQGIDTRLLLPISRAIDILTEFKPVGLVRDSYNHLIALTVLAKSGEVIIPVVDDGNSFHYTMDLRIHIGLQSVNLASANDVEIVYNTGITPYVYEITDLYELQFFIGNDVNIFGYRIGNNIVNINLPCENMIEGTKLETPIEIFDDFEFEYKLNREIIVDGRNSVYEQSPLLTQKEHIENIYQHLRLTFSKWVSVNTEGSNIRSSVKTLIERRDIPSFEKIRRLDIQLGITIKSWLSPDANPFNPEPVFLRTDCTKIEDLNKCNNYCQVSDGKCKIHTPQDIQISSIERVIAVDYLTQRLLDEIVRIPAKSNELLESKVKRIQIPKTNIHIKDQWIIPQGVPAWYELLRISNNFDSESPQYYEEFSRLGDYNNEDTNKYLLEIPDSLKILLPSETVNKLALRIIGQEALFFGISDEVDKPFSTNILIQISNKYKKPVIHIIINENPIRFTGRSIGLKNIKSSCIVIVTGLKEGPALLVTKDTMSDSVPSKYIYGPIYDSIEDVKVAKIFKSKVPRKFTTLQQT